MLLESVASSQNMCGARKSLEYELANVEVVAHFIVDGKVFVDKSAGR